MAELLDVREGNERRKRLLQQLMAQMQGSEAAAAGMGALPFPAAAGRLAGGAARMQRGDARTPFPHFTLPSLVNPGVRNALGPGGMGAPGLMDRSPGVGLPVMPPAPPRPQAPPAHAGGPGTLPVGPGGPPPGGPPAAAPQAAAPPTPAADPAPSTQLVPLGNGVYYDPNLDALRGMPMAPPTGSTARTLRDPRAGLGHFGHVF